MGIIYCYTNKNTGKKYIGQTIHPDQRKATHKSKALTEGSDYYFHRSIRKHGWDNFDYEVLEDNVEDLNDRENHYINMYDTLWPNGYNQCPAAALNKTAIEKMKETKRKQFTAMTEEERRSRVECMVQANKGSKRSEETKKKQSESAKKYLAENPRVRSEETKRKTSESMKKYLMENPRPKKTKKEGPKPL